MRGLHHLHQPAEGGPQRYPPGGVPYSQDGVPSGALISSIFKDVVKNIYLEPFFDYAREQRASVFLYVVQSPVYSFQVQPWCLAESLTENVLRGKPVRKVAALTPTFLPTFAIRLKSRSWCPHFFFKFPTILNLLFFKKSLYTMCLHSKHIDCTYIMAREVDA